MKSKDAFLCRIVNLIKLGYTAFKKVNQGKVHLRQWNQCCLILPAPRVEG